MFLCVCVCIYVCVPMCAAEMLVAHQVPADRVELLLSALDLDLPLDGLVSDEVASRLHDALEVEREMVSHVERARVVETVDTVLNARGSSIGILQHAFGSMLSLLSCTPLLPAVIPAPLIALLVSSQHSLSLRFANHSVRTVLEAVVPTDRKLLTRVSRLQRADALLAQVEALHQWEFTALVKHVIALLQTVAAKPAAAVYHYGTPTPPASFLDPLICCAVSRVVVVRNRSARSVDARADSAVVSVECG